MAGVIDENGVQWEPCMECGEYARLDGMYYEEPSEEYECGRDLCADCAEESDREVRRQSGIPIVDLE